MRRHIMRRIHFHAAKFMQRKICLIFSHTLLCKQGQVPDRPDIRQRKSQHKPAPMQSARQKTGSCLRCASILHHMQIHALGQSDFPAALAQTHIPVPAVCAALLRQQTVQDMPFPAQQQATPAASHRFFRLLCISLRAMSFLIHSLKNVSPVFRHSHSRSHNHNHTFCHIHTGHNIRSHSRSHSL